MQTKLRVQPVTVWVTDFTWKCTNHIPTSKVYTIFTESCPLCGHTKPAMFLRPEPPSEVPATPQVPTPSPVAPVPVSKILPFPAKVERVVEPEKAPETHPCAWPPCTEQARDTSPYCSKVCSDRCLRLRRKAEKGTATEVDKPNIQIMQGRIEGWTRR